MADTNDSLGSAGGRYEGTPSFSGAAEMANLTQPESGGQEQKKVIEKAGKIELGDLRPPHEMQPGEVNVILQRHGDYVRGNGEDRGSITPESGEDLRRQAEEYVRSLIESVPEEERRGVKFLFVASDTQYKDAGRRSYETGQIAEAATYDVLESMELDPSRQIVNLDPQVRLETVEGEAGGPRPMARLREPEFLDSPDRRYFDLLKEEHGMPGPAFFDAFESDQHAAKREEFGAEGPDDIARRVDRTVRQLARVGHRMVNPVGDDGELLPPTDRMVVWATTHYDAISPYAKEQTGVLGHLDAANQQRGDKTTKDYYLGVELGAGVSIKVDKDLHATSVIGGQEYEIAV